MGLMSSHTKQTSPLDQLISLLKQTHAQKMLNRESLRMIEGVVHVATRHVRDVMIPRAKMVVIEHNLTIDEALTKITSSRHSRFPVIGDDRDEVLGILLAKDVLAIKTAQKKAPIKNLVRPAVLIPESKRLDVLLKEFRLNRNHMAIILDEYGSVAGLVTIEDVLEQIVGNIEDEFDVDVDDQSIHPLNDDEFSIKASTPIETFNSHFSVSLDQDSAASFHTIGGLVLNHFGYLPSQGEKISIPPMIFTVLKASNRQLFSLTCRALPPENDSTDNKTP